MKSHSKLRSFLIACGSLLAASSLQAASLTWSGATNTWNTNTNWVGSVLPVSNDSLFFNAAGAGGLSLNNDLTSGSFTVVSMVFNSTAGAYVIGDGTATANAGNTFVLGAPAGTAAFTSSVTNGSGNLQTINTPFSMTGVRNFIGGTDITLAGNISGTGGGIRKSSSNTLTLSGTNTYTGVTQIDIGVLRLDSANAVPGGIGATGGLSNINLNGGVVGLATGDFTRSLNNTTSTVVFGGNGGWAAFGANRLVNLGGASALVTWVTATTGLNNKTLILGHATATHTVDFQNPLDMTNGGRTVQVDEGAAAIDAIISGNITGIASGNLSKTGNGTLMLSGAANNYVGNTTVSAGTLLINGTKSGTGTVTVNAGAALGGTGTINGVVTASAGGRLDLTDGAVGNLSLGSSLTLSGNATPNHLFFDLGNGAGGTDKIITTGAHAAASANGVQVHLNQLSGTAVDPGTYTLIQGGAASNFTGYTLATTRSGRNAYSALGANVNNLEVTVAAGTAGAVIDNHYWQGDTSVWNTAQWYSDATGTLTATAPGYSSNVRFGTTTAANLTNTLGEDYEINSLTVDAGLAATSISGNMLTIDATSDNNNAAGNGITVNNVDGTTIASKVGLGNSQTWTVDTGAALTVSGVVSDFGIGHSLTKAGAGTLTLSGVNTFSGPLTVSGGTLAIGGAGQLNNGSYGANIINNGTLSYNSSANQNLNGIISGSGSLTKSGGSTLTLINSGTFTGGASISGGSLSIGTANLVNPLGAGTTTVNTGGTYALSATTVSAPLVLNGGTVTAGNSFTSWINGPMTLDANSTISVSGNLTVNSNISGVGGLTKTLAAFVSLNGTNTYDGPTIIGVNGGGFTVKSSLYGNDTLKWIPANITVNSGGALVLNVGGAGEFTIAQAGTMFSQLGGVVNNNGLLAGSTFGIDTRNASGTFTISDDLVDSSGPGGGAIGFQFVGNGAVAGSTLELTGDNTYSGQTIIDRDGVIKVSSINSVNGGSPPLLTSSLGRPTTIANGTISLGISASFRGAGLAYTGPGEITDRVIKLGGGLGNMVFSLDQSGPGPSGPNSGLLKFTSNLTHGDVRGIKILQLQGSTAGSGEFAGQITNPSVGHFTAVTKNGTGTWTLSAANLNAGGVYTVAGGCLVLGHTDAIPGGINSAGGTSALTLNGGVIGLATGNFTRSLTAENTVTGVNFKNTAGGWAAYGADRLVNLGGASAAITWATPSTGLNGRTLILGNATATHKVTLENPLDLGTAARTVQVDNGTAVVDGALSGLLSGGAGGNLIKSGLGTLALTAAAGNSYVGTTTVNAGTLLVNNTTGSGTGAGNVSVTTGTLGGSGSISGTVTIGDSTGSADAILAPGNSIGAIATGDLAFNSDGSYACELNGTSVTTDVSNVTGTVTIDAATTLTVNVAGTLSASQSYVIVSNDAVDPVTGTFAGLAQDAVVGNFGGTDLKISYTGGDGNDIVLYTDASGSAYATWASTNATSGNPDDDFDGDGVSNAVEFVLGGLASTNDLGKLPAAAASGGNMTFTFVRDQDSVDGSTLVTIEVGTSLASWPTSFSVGADTGSSTAGVVVTQNSPSPGVDTVVLTVTQAPDTKKFARLKAVVTP